MRERIADGETWYAVHGEDGGMANNGDNGEDDLLAYAREMVQHAEQAGVTLRLIGSAACRLCSPRCDELLTRMRREPPGDIDLVGKRKQSKDIKGVMQELGYECDQGVIIASEGMRHIYTDADSGRVIDVFADELHYNHRIDLRRRLPERGITLFPTDLLLSKLQIVEINHKDILDASALVGGFEPEAGEAPSGERIEVEHILGYVSSDWGFYHTVIRNLGHIASKVDLLPGLNEGERQLLSRRISALTEAIEAAPKSARWKLRGKVGERMRWYQIVDEKGDTF